MSRKFLPWLSLVALLWLQSFNGTNLSFPAYSSQLKEFLKISQFKLNYLSFASDAGKVLGFISGIAAVYLPLPLVLLAGVSVVSTQLVTIVAINSFPVNRQVAVGSRQVIKADKTTSSSNDVKVGFIVLFVLTIATGIYAVATSLVSAPAVLVLVGIALFLLAPLTIPIGVGFKELMSSRKTQQKVHDLEAPPDKFYFEEEDHTKEEEEFEKEIIGVKEEIAESRGSTATSSLVALSSSFGFFRPLLPSLLDYFFSSTAMIGIFSGALTSLSVTMTAELFGTKHFGVNHNIVVGSIPLGSFSFGLLAAKVYRDGAALYGDDGKCFGMHCFQTTLVFWECSVRSPLFSLPFVYTQPRVLFAEAVEEEGEEEQQEVLMAKRSVFRWYQANRNFVGSIRNFLFNRCKPV
ncbi:unnamed protein product [Arabidopsis arenosa]|uniref:Nodulin-like domain-containing protein n=1 Tax=Arabidopsis arenosa TaxID=38785 RepID=A0A8S2A2N4_ARAAE|nr:unnamed protein product [Arabidopsis arenosa]